MSTHSKSGVAGPILLVEDDFSIRIELHALLNDQGFSVYNAADGADALELLPRMPRPCLIITDLVMPRLSGGEFVARLKADPAYRDIPVMVLSVHPNTIALAEAALTKPFDLETLMGMVKQLTQPKSDDEPVASAAAVVR